MAQTIKIKRSTGSSAPSTLANGELAYLNNSTSKKLYIGRPGGGTGDIDAIGGKDFTDKLDLIGAANGANAADARVVASGTNLGVIRIGDGLSINTNGVVSADEVTTASVRAAGALMDDEVTNLAQVKAFNSSDYIAKTGGTLTGNLSFGDLNKAIFGSGNDLSVYHDDTYLSNTGASFIEENGTGNLIIKGSNIEVRSSTNELYAQLVQDGVVQLACDNEVKLSTTGSGINVIGEVKGDSLDIDGDADISGDLTVHGDLEAGNFTFSGDTVKTSGSTMTLDPHDDGITGTVVINGDLEVKGVTTTIDSTTVTINDAYIQLNSGLGESDTPASSMICGFEVNRGAGETGRAHDAGLYWYEDADEWRVSEGQTASHALIHANNFESVITSLDGGTF